MLTAASFLETIRQHPNDDAPRLVYADWLEEQDDPRGEFIRVQIQLANLDPDDDEARWDLELRQQRLLRQHGFLWVFEPFNPARRWPQFRRGFVERVEIEAAAFLANAPAFKSVYPFLRNLAIYGVANPHRDKLARHWEYLDRIPEVRHYTYPKFRSLADLLIGEKQRFTRE